MIQGGSVIIADFEDMWGNVTNMGLGEHAIRIKAPPMFYDKRGNVIRYLDFESGTPNYMTLKLGTATIQRSTEMALTGNFSLKMDNPVYPDYSNIRIKTNDFHEKTVGMQTVFTATDKNGYIELYISHYSGTLRTRFRLRYNFNTGLLFIYSDDHAPYYIVSTLVRHFESNLFTTLKLTGDCSTGMYKNLQIFGSNFDISSISAETAMNATAKQLFVTFGYYYSIGATTLYIDNLIITENE